MRRYLVVVNYEVFMSHICIFVYIILYGIWVRLASSQCRNQESRTWSTGMVCDGGGVVSMYVCMDVWIAVYLYIWRGRIYLIRIMCK